MLLRTGVLASFLCRYCLQSDISFFPSDAICSFVICNESSLQRQQIIFNPDFFVEKLRHEKPDMFTELIVSNVTRLIDLPGAELAQLMGEEDPQLPGGTGTASGFFRSLMSLKRKGGPALWSNKCKYISFDFSMSIPSILDSDSVRCDIYIYSSSKDVHKPLNIPCLVKCPRAHYCLNTRPDNNADVTSGAGMLRWLGRANKIGIQLAASL